MQHWLSGFANWYAKRNRRSGHLFQGRYKAYLVEDAGYFWTLSRYIHLNPCQGSRPLSPSPDGWQHSSYPGYARKSSRVDWICYDELHTYWRGLHGGKDPNAAYRHFVQQGLAGDEHPLASALRGWVLGSDAFLKRMVAMAESEDVQKRQRTSRRMKAVSMEEVIEETAAYYDVDAQQYNGFRSVATGRDLAAWLCLRWTGEPLRVLSTRFGLSHPDSASNLVRRAQERYDQSASFRQAVDDIEWNLGMKTENQD